MSDFAESAHPRTRVGQFDAKRNSAPVDGLTPADKPKASRPADKRNHRANQVLHEGEQLAGAAAEDLKSSVAIIFD